VNRLTADFFRLFCLAAVMVNHTTFYFEIEFQQHHNYFSTEGFLAVAVRQLLRFTVPSFIILSAYGLVKKYTSSEFQGMKILPLTFSFYRDRAYRILLPFFLWTIVFMILNGRFAKMPDSEIPSGVIERILSSMFVDFAEPHLYFLATIVECYLVFPLLFRLKSYLFWFILLVLQFCLTSPLQGWISENIVTIPLFPSSFLVYWIFYFYTGILLARREKEIVPRIEAIPWKIILIAAAILYAAVLGEVVYKSYRYSNPDDYNHFNRNIVIPYIFVFWAILFRANEPVGRFFSENEKRRLWLKKLTGVSFSVYLFHVFFLKLFYYTPLYWEFFIFFTSMLAVSSGSMLLLSRLIPGPGWLRNLFAMQEVR